MSFGIFLALSLLVGGAAFVQGAVGIGFALIVAPFLGFYDPTLLPVSLLLLMVPLNLLVAVRERAAIDRRGAGWITIGRFFGTFLGMAVLAALSLRQLELAVGLLTILAAVVALAAPPFTPGRSASLGVGLFTGVTETATGIGGPPLALLYQHTSGAVLRSTVATCFLLGELLSLALLAMAGRVEGPQLRMAAMLVPSLLIGSLLSRHVHGLANGPGLRIAVLVFSIVSGAALLLKG